MENNNTILEEPVEEVKEEGKPLDPVESSALFINHAHNKFRQISYSLSERKKRAVARVLEAVLFEPLEKVELFGEQEEQLFELCQQIMYNKGVVLNYAMQRLENKVKKEGNTDGTEQV